MSAAKSDTPSGGARSGGGVSRHSGGEADKCAQMVAKHCAGKDVRKTLSNRDGGVHHSGPGKMRSKQWPV